MTRQVEMLYFPCRRDSSGHIREKLTNVAGFRAAAEAFLKQRYPEEWLSCDAIPQPVTHQYWNLICTAQGPFEVPRGYYKIRWETARDRKVYIVGTDNGEPCAYGPFYVHDVEEKELKGKNGRIFTEMASHLLKKD